MAPVPLFPAASLVITSPPQSPRPGVQIVISADGHETAEASETSVGVMGMAGASFRLVKNALLLVSDPPRGAGPGALTGPPFLVVGAPGALTPSPALHGQGPPGRANR